MMWRSFLVSWFVLVLAFAAAKAEGLTKKEQLGAKRLYDSKCVKCHRRYEPKDYSQEEWRLWMSKMSKKAQLKPGQEKLLNRYLDIYRTETPAGKIGNGVSSNQPTTRSPNNSGSKP